MLDHQLQTNRGLRPPEVLSLSSFQYVHTEAIFPIVLPSTAAYCNSMYLILWAISGGSCASASHGWYLYGHGSCPPTACVSFFEGRILLKYLFTSPHSLHCSESQKHGPPKLWLLNPFLCIAGSSITSSSAKKIKLSIRLVACFLPLLSHWEAVSESHSFLG